MGFAGPFERRIERGGLLVAPSSKPRVMKRRFVGGRGGEASLLKGGLATCHDQLIVETGGNPREKRELTRIILLVFWVFPGPLTTEGSPGWDRPIELKKKDFRAKIGQI